MERKVLGQLIDAGIAQSVIDQINSEIAEIMKQEICNWYSVTIDILTVASPFLAPFLAVIYGYAQWKEQIPAKAKHDFAIKLLKNFYGYRSAIRNIRRNYYFGYELNYSDTLSSDVIPMDKTLPDVILNVVLKRVKKERHKIDEFLSMHTETDIYIDDSELRKEIFSTSENIFDGITYAMDNLNKYKDVDISLSDFINTIIFKELDDDIEIKLKGIEEELHKLRPLIHMKNL